MTATISACSNKNSRLKQQIKFIIEIDKLKNVLRRTYHINDNAHENSAEHSWHIALAAMLLAEYADENIEVLRIIKMLLIHDIVEIETGDVFLYDEAKRLAHTEKEKAAANKIFGLLPDDQKHEYLALWQEFEAKKTPEAKFAKSIDRLLPILHNCFNNKKSWKENHITTEQVLATNKDIEVGSKSLWQYVNSLLTTNP